MKNNCPTRLPRRALFLAVWATLALTGASLMAADPDTLPAEVTATLSGGQPGNREAVLAALDKVLVERPELAAQPDTASALALLTARRLRAATPGTASLGVVSSRIVSAAPADRRGEIAGAVADVLVRVAMAPGPAPATAAAEPGAPDPEAGTAPGTQTGAPVMETGADRPRTSQTPEGTGPALGQEPGDEETARYSAGYPVGSFRAYPRVVVSEVYDDNIFATRDNTVDDLITVLSPSITLRSAWDEHAAQFRAGADVARYSDNPSEDYEDYWASADGRYDFSTDTNVFGGGSYAYYHESRESPDDVFGREPTTYEDTQGYGGMFHRLGRASIRVGGTYEQLDYRNVTGDTGLIINDDRDRQLYTGGIRAGYRTSERGELFAQAAVDNRRYDVDVDVNGFNRDSDGYRLIGGYAFNQPNRYRGELYAGHLEQDYDDPQLEDVSDLAFGGNLTWYPAPGTAVSGFVDRVVGETTLDGASSYLYTSAGGRVSHAVRPDLLANAGITFGEYDYQGIDRTDDVINASASLRYLLSRSFFLEAEYRLRHLDSTIVTEDYDRNQVFLRVGAEPFQRAAKPAVPLADIGDDPFSGPYIGVLAGYGSLDSRVTGVRGPQRDSTNLTADFGNGGATWGLLGGFGRTFGSWYAGLEAEGQPSELSWSFARDSAVVTEPSVRNIDVEKSLSYGLAARLGYLAGDRVLVYGRAGTAWTEFTTQYSQFGETIADQDDTLSGVRLGGGMEFQGSRGVFLRLDYTWTGYEDLDIDLTNRPENFDHDENIFWLGTGVRF
jgi:opacity protein-like surface antigen